MTTDTLEALREAREALAELVKVNEDHNAAVASVMGKPMGWKDAYLDKARQALSRIDAALAESERDMTEQQPVAWRIRRQRGDQGFGRPQVFLTEEASEGDLRQWRRNGYDITPLYASPDHIGNSTTMVPALGVEGVARTIAEADGVTWTKDRVNYRSVGHADEGPVAKYYRQARALNAAMEKNDG